MIRYQGDSYFRDYTRTDGLAFDANYTGRWEIHDSDDLTVASGVSALSGNLLIMEYRITSTDTAVLLGKYEVVFELTNTSTGFQREFEETIIFLTQNIT